MVKRGGTRGTSTAGCLLTLVLFGIVLYYGLNIGPIYLRYYQLKDAMQSNARLAPSLPDATIRRRLVDKVEELKLPDDARKFHIKRSVRPRAITIETDYSESVSLPFFEHTFAFHPRAEEPL